MCWRLRQRGTYVCMNLYRPPCELCSHNQYRSYSFEMPLRIICQCNASSIASGMPYRRASSRLSRTFQLGSKNLSIRLQRAQGAPKAWNVKSLFNKLIHSLLTSNDFQKCKWQCYWWWCFFKGIIDLTKKKMTFQWCYWRCISMVIAQMNTRMIKMNISWWKCSSEFP